MKFAREIKKEYKIKPFSSSDYLLKKLAELKKQLPIGLYELETFEGFDRLLVLFDPEEITEEQIKSYLIENGFDLI